MKFLISLFSVLLLSASCSATKENMSTVKQNSLNTPMDNTTLSGSYAISALDAKTPISSGLTIDFDNTTNKVSGFAGCNNFFGNYSISKNSISFSNIASTKKFCGKAIGMAERQFIETLSKATSFQVKDNILMLYNNEKAIVLTASKKTAPKKSTLDVVNNYNTITYKAMSRGHFDYVNISKAKVIVSSDRTLQNKSEYTCNAKDWEDLKKLLSVIDSETFINLKAPTNKRLYDGAAHTTLSYSIDDMVFTTPSFDEGHPPKEIEAVINKIRSIKQSVTKQ